MELDPKYKPELVTSTDPDRWVINHINVKPGGTVEATDGSTAIQVRSELGPDDVPGIVSKEAWKLARRDARKWKTLNDVMKLRGGVVETPGLSVVNTIGKEAMTFPNLSAVMRVNGEEPRTVVTIRPHDLMRLARAFGLVDGDMVTLTIVSGQSSPCAGIIEVVPVGDENARGVIAAVNAG